MRPRHLALALLVVTIWGVNFAIIKLGLRQVSPLSLAVARFALAAFPWVFFIRRPAAPWRLIALYSLFIFVGQFGLLFTGMKIGMSAGLSSLILQLQVFFTIGLSVALLGEKPTVWQIAGALLAFGGIAIVAVNVGGDVTLPGLVLLILAAASWGGGNVAARRISMQNPSVDVLSLVVWGSLIAVPPLLILAVLLDPQGLATSFVDLDWVSIGSILYIVYPTTLFGFAVWARLLGTYAVATVAPFTLLVPISGFVASAVLLDEQVEPWKIGAGVLVIAGLCINLFGRRLFGGGRASG
jgi:O-acetylserine/cysteine efflux transporter